jgi:phage FluMu gp28-like protein
VTDKPLPPELSPVIAREPDGLPEELPRGAEIPADLDPFADGILMQHQKDWLADDAACKIAEKGRRTGITFAEALDDTLIAAAARGQGGDNIFYIGDTKDKGREFIGYVAHFARIVAGELAEIEEFLFEDKLDDGSSRAISAYRVRFASAFRVEALSSRPENIRGLQGIVVIDEAAFHKNVRLVIDAVNALLIWGGRIRVISTHNGALNPFNELIRESLAGKTPFKVHHIPFSKAIENGLYRRVCLIKGWTWSAEAEIHWEQGIRLAYGARTAAMKQELDCIPSEAEGSALTRVQIEACMESGIPVVRLTKSDDFKNAPDHIRQAEIRDFCEQTLKPILARLDEKRAHFFGEDFARKGHATGIVVFEQLPTLVRRTRLILELHNVPFEEQKQILFYIVDRCPRMSGGALDATGNGAWLAEVTAQRYGERIVEVKLSAEWYRVNGAAYAAAFTDRTVILPRDEDVLRDHQALAYVNGVIRVPEDMEFKGSDGLARHGDTAIGGMLAWFASTQGVVEYGYRGRESSARDNERRDLPDDREDRERPWWKLPLGAGLRGALDG